MDFEITSTDYGTHIGCDINHTIELFPISKIRTTWITVWIEESLSFQERGPIRFWNSAG